MIKRQALFPEAGHYHLVCRLKMEDARIIKLNWPTFILERHPLFPDAPTLFSAAPV